MRGRCLKLVIQIRIYGNSGCHFGVFHALPPALALNMVVILLFIDNDVRSNAKRADVPMNLFSHTMYRVDVQAVQDEGTFLLHIHLFHSIQYGGLHIL